MELLTGYMGDTYRMGKAYDCHEKNRPSNATLCLEWMYQGRLSLSPFEMDDQSRCYRILWESLSPDVHPTDCYDMKGQSWYGAGALLGRYYHNAGSFQSSITYLFSYYQLGLGDGTRRYILHSAGCYLVH